MKFINLLLSGLTLSAAAIMNAQVVINEIQYSPVNGEPEWIELFNYSDNQVELKNTRLEDAVGSKVIPTFSLSRGMYAIITKDTLSLKERRVIPESAILIQAVIPTYNNDWDIVVLRKEDSTIVDSVYYHEKWGVRGISFERIDWSRPAVSSDNLAPSVSKDSATAGYINSTARKDFDIGIHLNNKPDILTDSISLAIKNYGRQIADKFKIYIYIDIDRNDEFNPSELFISNLIFNLYPDSSFIITFNKTSLDDFIKKFGKFTFRALLEYPSDEKTDNDTLISFVYMPYSKGTILVNEFMYDVSGQMSEFVELWNTSNENIVLDGWYIHDEAADEPSKYFVVKSENFIIGSRGYCVIAWDSLLFLKFPELIGAPNVFVKKSSLNLNQAGDDLVIKDPLLNTVDSLYYRNEWHSKSLIITKDISLEKINMLLSSSNPFSWSSCTDAKGATPGKVNSSYYEIIKDSEISANPNPFSPYSNGKDNLCIISYNFSHKQSLLNATIFDIHGYIVRKLATAELISSTGAIIWDGKNDQGYILPVGPYIIFFEAADTSSDKVINEKLLIVIGKQE